MRDASCLFCRIIGGEIPAARVFEDAQCIVIRDIQPQAKVHLLVLPREHVAALDQVGAGEPNAAMLGHLLQVATQVARDCGLLPAGFRTVINTGAHGGQSVFHLHVHVLGGEQLRGSFA